MFSWAGWGFGVGVCFSGGGTGDGDGREGVQAANDPVDEFRTGLGRPGIGPLLRAGIGCAGDRIVVQFGIGFRIDAIQIAGEPVGENRWIGTVFHENIDMADPIRVQIPFHVEAAGLRFQNEPFLLRVVRRRNPKTRDGIAAQPFQERATEIGRCCACFGGRLVCRRDVATRGQGFWVVGYSL